jgi:hypothetical protein
MFLRTRGGRGYQELRPPVCQKRSGRPDLDVCTSRCEPLPYVLSPLAFEHSFVGFKDFLDRLKTSEVRIGRGIGASYVSLSGVCPRFTRSPKDPYFPLAARRVARLCHSRRREHSARSAARDYAAGLLM